MGCRPSLMTHCGHITISGQHLNVDIFVGSVMEMELRMLRPGACRRNLSKLLATALKHFRPTFQWTVTTAAERQRFNIDTAQRNEKLSSSQAD